MFMISSMSSSLDLLYGRHILDDKNSENGFDLTSSSRVAASMFSIVAVLTAAAIIWEHVSSASEP
jgi:hypothetical protein